MSLAAKFKIIIPPQDIGSRPDCLLQLAAGDPSAFEWLYKNYCSKIYDYVHLLSGDATLSEDLVQEVFLKLWLNREKLGAVLNFNAYLHTAAKNLLLDRWRKEKREKESIKANFQTSSDSYTDADTLGMKEAATFISAAVDALPRRQQMVYRLIREEGKTRDQISKALLISPCTVKATMQGALSNLKGRLLQKGCR
jgi:RNA polymerase sigma-70 factor (family 1)